MENYNVAWFLILEIPYGQDDDADDIVEGCPDCVNSSEENLLIKTNVKTSAHCKYWKYLTKKNIITVSG